MRLSNTILLTFIFHSILSQNRCVEQWISMPVNAPPYLSEVWIQDSLKNIIEKRTIDFNGKSRENWINKTRSEYDSNLLKRVLSYTREYKKGKKPSIEMIIDYNSDNLMISNEIYDKTKKNNLTPAIYTNYYYDCNDNIIKEITTSTIDYLGNPSDTSYIIIEYKYDSVNLVEEWKVAEDSSIYDHFGYISDSCGNMIEKRLLDKLDYLEKEVYINNYDSTGKLIDDRTIFNNGALFRKHVYHYNSTGDLIELFEYASDTDKADVKIVYKYIDLE